MFLPAIALLTVDEELDERLQVVVPFLDQLLCEVHTHNLEWQGSDKVGERNGGEQVGTRTTFLCNTAMPLKPSMQIDCAHHIPQVLPRPPENGYFTSRISYEG